MYDCANTRLPSFTSCTTRESLVSSGGWNPEFNENITSRPFCLVEKVTEYSGKCNACNRSSHSLEYRMRLFGRKYHGNRAWESTRWNKEFAPSLFYQTPNSIEDGNNNEEDEDVDDSDGGNDDSDNEEDYEDTELLAAKKWKWWTRNVPEALK